MPAPTRSLASRSTPRPDRVAGDDLPHPAPRTASPRSSRRSVRARPTSASKPTCPTRRWQADFTHWRLADGSDVEILCWIDDHSRYAISVTAHRRVTGHIVVDTFTKALEDHGIPASTLTDNGMVFTTRLSGGKRRPQRLRTPPRQPRHQPEELETEPPDHLRQSRTLPPNPQTLARRPPRPGHHRRAPNTARPVRRRLQPAPPPPLTRTAGPLPPPTTRDPKPPPPASTNRTTASAATKSATATSHSASTASCTTSASAATSTEPPSSCSSTTSTSASSTPPPAKSSANSPSTRPAATTAPDNPSADHDDPTDPEKRNQPNPEWGFGVSGCLATSHGALGGVESQDIPDTDVAGDGGHHPRGEAAARSDVGGCHLPVLSSPPSSSKAAALSRSLPTYTLLARGSTSSSPATGSRATRRLSRGRGDHTRAHGPPRRRPSS